MSKEAINASYPIKDFNEYKKNLTLIEKRLIEDGNDLASDLQTAKSWVDHALLNGTDSEEKKYFFQESFPKILKSILLRKYDPSHNNFKQVLSFLDHSVIVIAGYINKYPEGMSLALREIMDPTSQFYRRYCVPKIEGSVPVNLPASEKFLSELDAGSVVDFLSSQNKWQMGIVERLSQFRTEVELSHEDGPNVWLSLEKDAHRIAEWGTKSGLNVPNATTQPSNTEQQAPSSASTSAQVLDVTDGAWKQQLNVGDLVDARDKNNMWFQACVLGVKRVEGTDNSSNSSNSSASSEEMEVAVSSPVVAVPVDPELDGMYDSETAVAVLASSFGTQTECDSPLPALIPVSAKPLPVSSKEKLLLHIAFIGHPERSDEWIDVLDKDSERIQQLNTFSFGRKGENPVREEVQFLANLIPSHGEIDSHALYREGCFVEAQFVQHVNVFGRQQGFDVLLQLLQRENNYVSVLPLLNMAVAVGNMHKVLSKSFLASFGPKFLDSVASLLRRMELPDLREVPVELLEQVFAGLENIATAHFGRNAATGKLMEPLKLDVALRSLACPYLNRRLGGLKILADLLRRAENSLECPTGLRVSTTTSNGVETTSYRVVPVTYHLSISALCQQLVDHPTILGLFEGGGAHESLMARSSSVLCSLAGQNCLGEKLLPAIWTAGFTDKKPEALRALADMMAHLDNASMSTILASVQQLTSAAVTPGLVEIVASVAVRCRGLLFSSGTRFFEPADSSSDHSLRSVCTTYFSAVNSLWGWVEDGSEASEAAVKRVYEKLESVLDIGCSAMQAYKDESFPWAMHWHRLQGTIEGAVSSVRQGRSVVQATKVLTMAIQSWPLKSSVLMVPKEGVTFPFLPFPVPNRSDLMSHLVAQFDILNVLMECMAGRKQALSALVAQEAHSNSEWQTALSALRENHEALPQGIQDTINALRIGQAREGYATQLKGLAEFVHRLVRFSDNLFLSKEALVRVWEGIAVDALTAEEAEAVASFFEQVLIKSNSVMPLLPAMSLNSSGGGNSVDSMSVSASRRNAVASSETVQWFFANFLCNSSSTSNGSNSEGSDFVRSPYFGPRTLTLMEKWFRWVNAEAGLLVEAPGTTGNANKSAPTFLIVSDPAALQGLALFPAVIFTCVSDKVATAAVQFLTSLPQHLSVELKASDALVTFRSVFVSRCMQELERLSGRQTTVADNRLARVLLYLDGILEESAASDTDRCLVPHGTIGKGNSVTFNVKCTSKTLKPPQVEVTVSMADSVEDLLSAVAAKIHSTLPEIKVFRLGREILPSEYKKSIAQLRGNNINPESLLVSERPHFKIKSPCSSPVAHREKPHESSQTEHKPCVSAEDASAATSRSKAHKTSLPAWILANGADNFELLFNLLQRSEGQACDQMWGLITKLPTSSAKLETWLALDCGRVEDLLLSSEDPESLEHLSELLYNLQLVEVLLQPSSSREEFQTQLQFITDVDIDLLQTWAQRFSEKGGFAALCAAYSWVLYATEQFTSGTVSTLGVSAQMLQTTIALALKLVRAYLVRLSGRNDEQAALAVLRSLKKRKDAKNKPPSTSAATSTNTAPVATAATAAVVATAATVAKEDDKKNSEASAVAVVVPPPLPEEDLDALLGAEWGWRVVIDGSLRECVGNVDLQQLLKTTLSLQVALRKLSHHQHYIRPASGLYEQIKLVNARHEEIGAALEDSLAVWSSLVAVQPDLLLLIQRTDSSLSEGAGTATSIDCRVLLSDLLLGGFDVPRVKDFHQESQLSLAIGEWFATALPVVLQNAAHLTLPNGESTSALSPADTLCHQVFLTLLDLRPALVDRVSAWAVKKTAPLFTLASAILDSRTPSSLAALPAEVRSRTCAAILEELTNVSRMLRQDPSCQFHNLDGTMKLLAALPAGDEHILSTVFTRKVQEFLLTYCLGLVGLRFSGDPVVCCSDESRRHVYDILLAVAGKNVTMTRKILSILNSAHSSVATPVSWDFRPERENRSSTGFVGLKNLGSTCYMNSLLQVLFMNRDIREYLLTQVSDDGQADEVLRNDLAFQLRKVFYCLQHSEKKAFTPSDWTFAFKDDTGAAPINVMQQQDAQEFLQLLCERFEHSVAAHNSLISAADSSASAVPLKDILHGTFGGKLCNQMFQSNIPTESSASGPEIREQEESFVCISLDVKGCKDLEASLNKFVEGEQIGDYQWREGSAQRETITKRQCVAQLNDTLVFHLKRFELNFDTFRREKVNDPFPFPLKLNMRPFTKEGLQEKTFGVNSGGSTAQGRENEYYEYELGGVVVHTGTTDSGHYFAYIKDSQPEETSSPPSPTAPSSSSAAPKTRWLEFNDSEVTLFSEQRIEAECFGGKTSSGDYDLTTKTFTACETVNPKSAYMLVYNRVKKINTFSTTPQTAASTAAVSSPQFPRVNSGRAVDFSEGLEPRTVRTDSFRDLPADTTPVAALAHQVKQENAQHALSLRVLNLHHLTFYKNIVQALFAYRAEVSDPFDADVLEDAYSVVTRLAARTAHSNLFVEFAANLIRYLDSYAVTGLPVSVPHSTPTKDVIDFASVSSPAAPDSPAPPGSRANIEAIKLKREMQRAGTMNSPRTPGAEESVTTAPSAPVNQLLLCSALKDFESVMNNLFAPKEEVRKQFALLYLKLYEMAAKSEPLESFTRPDSGRIDMKAGLITTVFEGSSGSQEAVPTIMDVDGDDADLLMAIAMSQGGGDLGESQSSPQKSSAPLSITSLDNAISRRGTVQPDRYDLLAPRFLWELTMDGRMQQVAEQWRKCSSFVWLLLEISKLGFGSRDFLVRRQVVAQIVDIILGDQSPLCGTRYAKGSRKRAPSSYVAVNVTKDGSVPLSARNIPDWTTLVDLLAVLAKGCVVTSFPNQQRQPNRSYMDETDLSCLQVKTLLSTLLKQPRYAKATQALVLHLSYDNPQYSDLVCEAVSEELGMCAIENTHHLFDLLQHFLGLFDNLRMKRCTTVFGNGPTSLLEFISANKDIAPKARFVCVLIRSTLALMNANETVAEGMTRPLNKFLGWAPWMLKFCFRFNNKCSGEQQEQVNQANANAQLNQAIIASHGQPSAPDASQPKDSVSTADTSANPLLTKGPYLLVYGETDDQREMTWAQRAESTFAALNAFISSRSGNPNTLMPEDAFAVESGAATVSSATDVMDLTGEMIGPLNFGEAGHSAGGGNTEMMGGAMTDEEFARYMESNDLAALGLQ